MRIELSEHLPGPLRALHEPARLFKPGCLTHFSPYFYYTDSSRYFYKYWRGELGFEIEDMQRNGNYFEYRAQGLPRIGKKYAGMTPTWLEQNATNIVLELLNRLSQNDNSSEELLACGLFHFTKKP